MASFWSLYPLLIAKILTWLTKQNNETCVQQRGPESIGCPGKQIAVPNRDFVSGAGY